jgi:hypothetical protein
MTTGMPPPDTYEESGPVQAASAMPSGSRWVLLLPVVPDWAADIEAHVQDLVGPTGLSAWDVRQRLLQGGVVLLKHAPERATLDAVASHLRERGYGSMVLATGQIRRGAATLRAASAVVTESAVVFENSLGEEVFCVDSRADVLLVVADLYDSRDVNLVPGHQTPAACARAGRGRDPVLRLFGTEPDSGAVLFGNRFNFSGLGLRAGSSAARNFAALVDLLLEKGRDVRVDTSFSLSAPIFGVPSSDPASAGPAASDVEAHARCVEALWRAGLWPPPGLPAESRAEQPPIADFEPAPIPPPDPTAGKAQRNPSRRSRSWRSLRALGPAPVVAPLALAVPAALISSYVWAPGMPVAAVAFGLLALLWAFAAWRQKLRVDACPRSRADSLKIGRAELAGRAVPCTGLKTPYTWQDAVWYEARMERRTEGSERRRRRWEEVQSLYSGENPFFLEDETGRVLVDPAGALFDVHDSETLPGGPSRGGNVAYTVHNPDIRCFEDRILAGTRLYVLGQARPVAAASENRRALQEQLRALKHDNRRMAALDHDGDGQVDEGEWDEAVEATRRELARGREASTTGGLFVGAGTAGELFLISDHDEATLRRQLLWRVFVGVAVGLGLLSGGVLSLAEDLRVPAEQSVLKSLVPP